MTPIRRSLLALSCLAGCGGDPSPSGFATDHVVVEPTDSAVVCRGTLEDMETQVARVSMALNLDVPFPITVYFGPTAVKEHCPTVPSGLGGGCTNGFLEETAVASEEPSIYHELVHAARRTNGIRGPSFFEEGIAIVLGGFRPYPFVVGPALASLDPENGPEALAHYPAPNIPSGSYAVAAHFMAWLIATYGQETVTAFLNDPELADATDDTFLDHFGLTLAEAEQAWRTTSEPEYRFGEVCDPERALAWSGDTLEYTAELACDAPNVLGPTDDRIALYSTCFSLEQPATLHVELIASAGGASFRNTGDCLALGPLPKEHFQTKSVAAGEAIDLPFAPCAWEVSMTTELAAETDFTLRLTR